MKPLILVPGQFENYRHEQIMPERQPWEIILEQLANNTCGYYILWAGTSTGKSSAFVNQLLLDAQREGKSVYTTQPKVALCVNKMTDLPVYQTNLTPGKNLGYICGNNMVQYTTEQSNLIFMTTEKCQQMLLKSINRNIDELSKVKYLCIDEAHDISEQMIFTLLVIKEYKKIFNSPDSVKVIFMSATLDIDRFQHYYNITLDDTNYGFIRPMQAKSYVRTILYLDDIIPSLAQEPAEEQSEKSSEDSTKESSEEPTKDTTKEQLDINNPDENPLEQESKKPTKGGNKNGKKITEVLPKVLDKCYEVIAKNMKINSYKDVLIFCCNTMQIRAVEQIIRDHPPKFKFITIPYTSADIAGNTENNENFNNNNMEEVKFIISTNLLEAGATIPNLYCIIDLGQRFYPVVNILNNESIRLITAISESSKEQRIGRIGRNNDGYAFLMYRSNTKFFEDPSPMILPNVLSLNIVSRIMSLLCSKYTIFQLIYTPIQLYIQKYPLLQNMSADLLNKLIYQLKFLGIIDNNNFITFFGIYCIYNRIDFVEMFLLIYGANAKQVALFKGIINSRMFYQQKLDVMDAIYYKDSRKLSQVNIESLSEALEDSFSYYLDRYKKDEEKYYTNSRKQQFDYRGFRDLLVQSSLMQ